jgi:hypothetical protein
MTFKFWLNGKEFWIDEFVDGYVWFTKGVEGNPYRSISQAQQAAIDWEAKQEKEVYDIGQYHDDRRE